jgi:hypothetical protein
MAHDYDEWIKTLPGSMKVRYSYQLLTTGFSASAEILEPVDAIMVNTHIHIDLPAPDKPRQRLPMLTQLKPGEPSICDLLRS